MLDAQMLLRTKTHKHNKSASMILCLSVEDFSGILGDVHDFMLFFGRRGSCHPFEVPGFTY
jgi:hypothetical protein